MEFAPPHVLVDNVHKPCIEPCHLGRLCVEKCECQSLAGCHARNNGQRLELDPFALDAQLNHRADIQRAFRQDKTPTTADVFGASCYSLSTQRIDKFGSQRDCIARPFEREPLTVEAMSGVAQGIDRCSRLGGADWGSFSPRASQRSGGKIRLFSIGGCEKRMLLAKVSNLKRQMGMRWQLPSSWLRCALTFSC